MKILIITIHNIGNNFGSTIQSCALYDFLKNKGYDVRIIDYRPQYGSCKQKIKEYLIKGLFLKSYLNRKKSFKAYYLKHTQMTKKVYRKFNQLRELSDVADVYITGSDQVWNPNCPCGNDDAYYLKFTNSPNKMSYAASLGTMLDKVRLQFVYDKIKDYIYISVREYESKQQLGTQGLNNVVDVLDPVFLHSKEYYLQDIKDSNYNVYGKYVLVYAVKENELISQTARKLAEKYGMKIILIGGFKRKCICDYFIRSAGPNEFLGLINNAQMVITSSFHATALSLILNKQFLVVRPQENSLRLDNILQLSKTTNRIISKIEDIYGLKGEIDYESTNDLLKPLINKSKQFLIDALNNFEKEK